MAVSQNIYGTFGSNPINTAASTYQSPAPAPTVDYGPNGSTWGSGANPYLEQAANQYLGAYTNPTVTSQLTPYLTQQLTTPGQGSTYYGQTGGFYTQPTSTSTLYNQVAGQYQQPTALSGLSLSAYANPLASEGLAGQAQSILGGPSASSGNYAWAQGQVQGPTELQQQGARLDADYSGANYLQQSYADLQGGYRGADLLSNYATNQAKALDGPGALEANAAGIAGQYGNADFLQNASPEIRAQILASRGLTDYVNSQTAGLVGPGMYEQFAQQQLDGNNPYYAQIAKEGRAAIDQAAIARGAYGSGGALASLGNYQAHLDAEQFNNLAGQLQAAQQLGQSRMNLGGQLFQASDNTGLQRAGALQGLATGQSTELQNQARGLQGLYGDVQSLGQARIGLGANIAGAADASRIARTQGLQNLAGATSTEQLARTQALQGLYDNMFNQRMTAVNTGTNAASAADLAEVNRLAGIVNATTAGDRAYLDRLAGQRSLAEAQDTTRLNYLNSSFDAANMNDINALNRITSGQDAANKVDVFGLAQLGALSGIGQTADTMNLNYLNSMFNVAGAAQGAADTRINGMLDNEFRADALASGLVGGFYQNGGQFSGDAAIAGINAGANAAQLEGQAQNATGNFIEDLIKTYFGGKKAGAF